MAQKDYYDVLGVERDVDAKKLKSAYRKLAMKYHPDRNDAPDAEEKLKEINEAYDVLKDEKKRQMYDRFGHAAFENDMGGDPGHGAGGGFEGFADLFEDMFGGFGGGGRRRQSGRGADLQHEINLSLEDAHNGKTVTVRVPTTAVCDRCHGNGAEPGTNPSSCNACGGRGKVRASQGFFTIERTCAHCSGRGETITSPCRTCSGQGRVQKVNTLSITIPAGVEDGMRIRSPGNGEAGLRGAPAGDLYLMLNINQHPIFQRHGADLLIEVPISMTKAALGGHVEVPSIDGSRSRVTITEGTQSGKRLRLRGKGMNSYQMSQRGDLYIELTVETPTNLTSRQRELLEEFEKEAENCSPQSDSFFNRVKSFFGNA